MRSHGGTSECEKSADSYCMSQYVYYSVEQSFKCTFYSTASVSGVFPISVYLYNTYFLKTIAVFLLVYSY